MTTISDVIGICATARDTFKQKYDSLLKRRKEAEKQAKEEYRGARLTQEQNLIKIQFDGDIQALRESIREQVNPTFADLRAAETGRVRLNMESLRELSQLSEMPLSKVEIGILVKNFGGKNYFTDRKLAQIAEQNAVTAKDVPELKTLVTSIDSRLSILNDLHGQLEKLLREYNGEVHIQTEMYLNDRDLNRALETYTGGFPTNETVEQSAARLLLTLKDRYKSDFERGFVLKNAMQNASPELKLEMLNMIASDTVQFSEIALNAANLTEQVQDFRDNDLESYSSAKQALKAAKDNRKDESALASILEANRGNQYFQNMIAETSEGDTYIAKGAASAGYEGIDVSTLA